MPDLHALPLAWTLREIACLERGGVRPARLTEAFPTSFALDRWAAHPTRKLDEATALALIDASVEPDDADRLGTKKRYQLVSRGNGA